MEPQLYMWSILRERFIKRHEFYVEQIRRKILVQFQNIEDEAEAYSEAEYERLGQMPYREDIDMGDIAGWATDAGHERYSLLHDLKKQIFLGALAGLYHQWDKDLRDFIEKELRHNYEAETIFKIAWDPNIGNIFDVLKQFGWDIKSAPWFPYLDACRLIVNVHKHGKGRSLNELAQFYPAYLKNVLDQFGGVFATANRELDHEWLEISEKQFEEIAGAMRSFWTEFPERSFLISQTSS